MADVITYMHDILEYPLPNTNCVVGECLQDDIIIIMQNYSRLLRKMFRKFEFATHISILGTSINKFLECCILISKNVVSEKKYVDLVI